jgi:DNA-binding CsgD family transcriptional regulator
MLLSMRLDDSSLLASLHDGMFQQPLWHDFLERLRGRVQTPYAGLIFCPPGETTFVELQTDPARSLNINRIFADTLDIRSSPRYAMREGRVYALDELIEAHDAALSAWRDEELLPLGIEDLRAVRVAEASGVDVWLIIGGRQLSSSATSLLTALAPHLRIAMRGFVALERERLRSSLASEAFGRLNFGWLTLDAHCHILDMTTHVDQLFQRNSLLRRGRYDRLTPASPELDRELTALVKQFAQDAEARPRAINLSRDPWMDMLVAPFRGGSVAAGGAPVAIVYLSGDRSSQADRCEQLVELFGLLPSEARLAWEIAQGIPIADAAANLNLTVETARNYSKKIYAKMGARGQAELVRIILSSVLAIA